MSRHMEVDAASEDDERAREDMIQQLQAQIATLQAQVPRAQAPAPAPAYATSTNPAVPTKILPKLAAYSGDRKQLESWISDAESKVEVDYALVPAHITFLALKGSLEGDAKVQINAWAALLVATDMRRSPTGLISQLRTIYGDPMRSEKAMRRLHSLHQGKRTFQDFLADFLRTENESGFVSPEFNRVQLLDRGLSMDMRTHMFHVPRSTSFHDFIHNCRTVADQLDAMRSQQRYSLHVPTAATTPATAPAADAMDWVATPPMARRLQNKNAATPLNGPRAKWVTQEVLADRRAQGLCLRCGASGHRISNCTTLPARRPTPSASVRVQQTVGTPPMLEDEVEVAEETVSSEN